MALAPPAFPDRFALARFPESGVLLNVQTGTYFRLNASATVVCATLIKGGTQEEARTELVDRYGIAGTEATAAVSAVLGECESVPAAKQQPAGAFVYQAAPSGWTVSLGSRPLVEIDHEGRSLRLCDPTAPMPLDEAVRAVVPKALFLQGVSVLHVACCQVNHELVGFGGASGAGKTTAVQALVAAGARPISEDTVAVATGPSRFEVFTDSERHIRAWRDDAIALLVRDPARVIDCSALSEAARGPVAPLRRLLFLDRTRRTSDEIRGEPLDGADAMVNLLDANFLGSASETHSRRYFGEAEAFARNVPAERASVPDGIDRLAVAARAWVAALTGD